MRRDLAEYHWGLGSLLVLVCWGCSHHRPAGRAEVTAQRAQTPPSLRTSPSTPVAETPPYLNALPQDLAQGSTAHDPFVTGTDLNSVWAFADYLVYAVGDHGAIVRWDGSRWNLEASGTRADLHGIWGSDPQHLFVVGAHGVVMTSDGKSWRAQQLQSRPTLLSVSGRDASHVWAVGEDGTIAAWNGVTWTRELSGTTQRLQGVWASEHGEVWAVGAGFTRLRRKSSGWIAIPARDYDDRLYAVWGFSDGSLVAVGKDNTVAEWDGTQWQYYGCFSDYADCERYYGVYGSDANNRWIIDHQGAILKLGQGIVLRSGRPLYGIHGFRRQSVWAVGERGRIWYYDGTRWTRTDPGPIDSEPSGEEPNSRD